MVRRLLNFAAVAVVCLAGARLGLWFVPFIAGFLECATRRRARGLAPLTAAAAVAGWALSLWLMALDRLPVGATARVIAALAGLPPYAAVAVTATLALAALQALAGSWLACAVIPKAVTAR